MNTIFKYSIFAIFSTLVNIFIQYISFNFYRGFLSLYVAMFFGTIFGLFVKYYLDKKYIFIHKNKSKKDGVYTFLLYSFMGVFTTILSWSIEVFFHTFWHEEYAKYIGALVGQILGYITKYNLDKRFVFKEKKNGKY